MAFVADQDDIAPFTRIALHFHVDFRDQWASGVENIEAAASRFLHYRARDTVRGEDYRGTARHFAQLVDEYRAQRAQTIDDVSVVHDFVPHIYRRPEELERALDDFNRAIDTGAEAPGVSQQDLH